MGAARVGLGFLDDGLHPPHPRRDNPAKAARVFRHKVSIVIGPVVLFEPAPDAAAFQRLAGAYRQYVTSTWSA